MKKLRVIRIWLVICLCCISSMFYLSIRDQQSEPLARSWTQKQGNECLQSMFNDSLSEIVNIIDVNSSDLVGELINSACKYANSSSEMVSLYILRQQPMQQGQQSENEVQIQSQSKQQLINKLSIFNNLSNTCLQSILSYDELTIQWVQNIHQIPKHHTIHVLYDQVNKYSWQQAMPKYTKLIQLSSQLRLYQLTNTTDCHQPYKQHKIQQISSDSAKQISSDSAKQISSVSAKQITSVSATNFLTSLSPCDQHCLSTFYNFITNYQVKTNNIFEKGAYVWAHDPAQIKQIPISYESYSQFMQIAYFLPSGPINMNWLIFNTDCHMYQLFMHLLPYFQNPKITNKAIWGTNEVKQILTRNKIINNANYQIQTMQHGQLLSVSTNPSVYLIEFQYFKQYHFIIKELLLLNIQETTHNHQDQRIVLMTSHNLQADMGLSLSNTQISLHHFNVVLGQTTFHLVRESEQSNIVRVRIQGEEQILSVSNKYKRIQEIEKIVHDQQMQAKNKLSKVPSLNLDIKSENKVVQQRIVNMQKEYEQKKEQKIKQRQIQRQKKLQIQAKNQFKQKLNAYHINVKTGKWVLTHLQDSKNKSFNYLQSDQCSDPLDVQYLHSIQQFVTQKIKDKKDEQKLKISYCLDDGFLLISIVDILRAHDLTIDLCHEDEHVRNKLYKIGVLNDFSALIEDRDTKSGSSWPFMVVLDSSQSNKLKEMEEYEWSVMKGKQTGSQQKWTQINNQWYYVNSVK